LTNGRTGSGIIQGYGKVYFPAIEYNIQLDGLPDDLKYLSVIESSLRPYATSTAGAAGLWQIMPNTARLYGLVIDDYVDERRDPYRSTEVALKYLQHLYQEFHSWELAMAAYNCGPVAPFPSTRNCQLLAALYCSQLYDEVWFSSRHCADFERSDHAKHQRCYRLLKVRFSRNRRCFQDEIFFDSQAEFNVF